MGLNPSYYDFRQDVLHNRFNGGSPYFDMFTCGFFGVPLEECVAKCKRNNIPLRRKDIQNYENGAWANNVRTIVDKGCEIKPTIQIESMKLEDFPMLPVGWRGTDRRFFPCTQDNKPMQKWGWTKDYSPELFTRADAKALSPCGWVGQNMLYQRFIVIDIDGRGHGQDDVSTIMFGNIFKDSTCTMEDPKKPGSFHLYFETDRLIPVRHFPWAKIDLMGNAVNAAVYFKNKVWNGVPMRKLDQNVWRSLMVYQQKRKEMLCL